jgi:DNA-binding transcriptional LysR family regulator
MMIAQTQYKISHSDLTLVLALVRGRSLARAAEQLQVDVSTVFRAIRKLETNLGVTLFNKNRRGYTPTQSAQALAEQAECAERALDAAQIALQQGENVITGTLRVTCTDAVLHHLLLPSLAELMPRYPALSLELATSNAFANLSRRDADIALRLSNAPPEHLIGRQLGHTSYYICGRPELREGFQRAPASLPWVSPDESMLDHVSVAWRRQAHPSLVARYRCSNMSAIARLVQAGLGVAALPDFMLHSLQGVERLSPALPDCNTDLWLLTRPDCLALRSVQTLFDELTPLLRHHLTG